MELKEDNLSDVLEDLLEAQNKSRYLGLALKIPTHVLDAIHSPSANPQDCLRRVLEEFLRGVDPRPTWSVIAAALKNPSVNLHRLAEKIETKYDCHPSPEGTEQAQTAPVNQSAAEALSSGKGQNTSNGAVHDTSIGVTAMETGTIADLKKGVKSSDICDDVITSDDTSEMDYQSSFHHQTSTYTDNVKSSSSQVEIRENELEIEINGTYYSLVEPPKSNTDIVEAEREKLLPIVDLKTLVEDLGRVGRCIHVAYYSVTAAGPKFTELQIEVQGLRYDIAKLCDKSVFTVSKFEAACDTVLSDLQTTYEFLLENLEKAALHTLSAVSKKAGKMAAMAQDLHNDFEKQCMKVQSVENKTRVSQSQQAILKQKCEEEKELLKSKQVHQKVVLENARKAEEEMDNLYRVYEMKEDKAIMELGDQGNAAVRLINAFTSISFGTRLFGENEGVKKQKIQHLNRKKLEVLERRKEWEGIRREANEQLIEFAIRIKQCDGEKEMAEAACDALHEAKKCLAVLATLMMQATLFWKQVEEHCNNLKEHQFTEIVENTMKSLKDTERRKLWTSWSFKKSAIRFCAGWVALRDVCGEHMVALKETRQKFYKYITDNPSWEEAVRNVKPLAIEFHKELGETHEAISQKISETDEGIKSLSKEQEEDK